MKFKMIVIFSFNEFCLLNMNSRISFSYKCTDDGSIASEMYIRVKEIKCKICTQYYVLSKQKFSNKGA